MVLLSSKASLVNCLTSSLYVVSCQIQILFFHVIFRPHSWLLAFLSMDHPHRFHFHLGRRLRSAPGAACVVLPRWSAARGRTVVRPREDSTRGGGDLDHPRTGRGGRDSMRASPRYTYLFFSFQSSDLIGKPFVSVFWASIGAFSYLLLPHHARVKRWCLPVNLTLLLSRRIKIFNPQEVLWIHSILYYQLLSIKKYRDVSRTINENCFMKIL